MKRVLLTISAAILLFCFVGCKYFVDDEAENNVSPVNGGVDFESIREDQMFMQRQQMEIMQKTIRSRGGTMGRRPF